MNPPAPSPSFPLSPCFAPMNKRHGSSSLAAKLSQTTGRRAGGALPALASAPGPALGRKKRTSGGVAAPVSFREIPPALPVGVAGGRAEKAQTAPLAFQPPRPRL